MTVSASKRRANDKWDAVNMVTVGAKVRKAEGEAIRSAAARAGQSVQAYILQAVRERMEREKSAGG